MKITRSITVDSLGACQGISFQNGTIYLYGDREVGVVRKFRLVNDSLTYLNAEYKLTVQGKDLINHPTGIAYNGRGPTFIGNTTRLPGDGNLWKAEIFCVDWKGLLKTGTLDGNVLNRIEDDACIQGARPEYVNIDGAWYVATADYGNRGNEVRLYYPDALAKAKRTSDPGLLYKKFTCSPWVQNLLWIRDKGLLLLIENEGPGRKWRFTYLDLKKSVALGKQVIVKEISVKEKSDELEGYSLLGNDTDGIAVSSSKKDNITFTRTSW
jgi:hypothetical protein